MNERPPSPEEGGSVPHDSSESAAMDEAATDPIHHLPADTFVPGIHATPGAQADARSATATEGDGAPEPEPSAARFPWPPAEGESILTAAGRTWRETLFSPASFFRRMPREARLGPALAYFLALTILGAGIQLFWDMLFLALFPTPAEGSAWRLLATASASDALISFFLSPVVMIAALFIGGAVTHALLKLMGGAGGRYGTTVRVFAYTQSAQLFVIVPVVGWVVAGIWALIVSIIGLREAHGTSTGKAAAAVLLPVVILLALTLTVIMVVVAGAVLLRQPG